MSIEAAKATHIDRLLEDSSKVTDPHPQLVENLLAEIERLRNRERFLEQTIEMGRKIRANDLAVERRRILEEAQGKAFEAFAELVVSIGDLEKIVGGNK